MDTFIVQLINMQRTAGRLLGGVFGALLGILIAGTRWMQDESRRWRDRLDRLDDRVDAIENRPTTSASVTAASLTTGEAQLLGAGNLSVADADLSTFALKTYTGNDINRVANHVINMAATGTVTAGTIASVRWPTALASARCPELLWSYGDVTDATAAKRIGLIPTFNSTNQNTGYDVDAGLALASGDTSVIHVRVREIQN